MNGRRCGVSHCAIPRPRPFPFLQIFLDIVEWLNRYCRMDSILCRIIRSHNLRSNAGRSRIKRCYLREHERGCVLGRESATYIEKSVGQISMGP